MPALVHSKEISVKRERVITEIKVDGKLTVGIGSIVRERNTGGNRGVVFKLNDPEEYPSLTINVCLFSGEILTFSIEDFIEQCEVVF